MEEAQRRAYTQLVEKVRQSYAEEQNGLVWCDACQEINLWTYWQGRNAHRVKILLVGQDWGSVYTEKTKNWVKKMCSTPRGEDFPYMEGNKSPTDQNLVELFKTIGYNVDKNEEKNRELFFTNLVLGYRNGPNISGGYDPAWGRKDGAYFRELVDLLDPEYLFCLGQTTFRAALAALGVTCPRLSPYNDFLRSEQNPVHVVLDSGTEAKICALAHCGGMGTNNRNDKIAMDKRYRLDRQKVDWNWVLRGDQNP